MKNLTMKMRWAALLALGLSAVSAAAQGGLTPPGAPAPTMKTLDQVEPRTPISSAPYYIWQPGSYYLTTNLTSTGQGVVIGSSDVTLDLMGFTLSGVGEFSNGGLSLNGATYSAIRNIVVRNGTVRNFDYGLRGDYVMNSRFEDLILDANRYFGVYLNGTDGQCDGNTLTDCTMNGNGSYGVRLSDSSGNTFADCTINENGFDGIYLTTDFGQCNGNIFTDCIIMGNGNSGVFFSGQLAQCEGNIIADCIIRQNGGHGVYMYFANANRVEGNHLTGNTVHGIYCHQTTKNFIVRNTCVGQASNFVMSTDDTYGPIVTNSGPLSTTGAGAHPWANFSR